VHVTGDRAYFGNAGREENTVLETPIISQSASNSPRGKTRKRIDHNERDMPQQGRNHKGGGYLQRGKKNKTPSRGRSLSTVKSDSDKSSPQKKKRGTRTNTSGSEPPKKWGGGRWRGSSEALLLLGVGCAGGFYVGLAHSARPLGPWKALWDMTKEGDAKVGVTIPGPSTSGRKGANVATHLSEKRQLHTKSLGLKSDR